MATSDKPLIFHRHALYQEKKDTATLPCQEVAFDIMTLPPCHPKGVVASTHWCLHQQPFFKYFISLKNKNILVPTQKLKKKPRDK